MRTSLSRVATLVMVGLLVTGCASATSPVPGTTPSPSQLSTAAPPDATLRPTSSPAQVTPTMGRIAAGYEHTCVVTDRGGVKCWGANGNGQLGNGTSTYEAVPGPVDVVGLASGVSAIAAGAYHTCVLTDAGGVKCWGSNSGGELGNGRTNGSATPADVPGLSSGITAISAGGGHTCALTSGGGVRCWGSNLFGALGDGTNLDSSVPVDVVGLDSGISMIAAGGRHTCALTRGGSVTCWGDGQHDDAEVHHTNVPVDVPRLWNDVRLIAAGNFSTCAVRNQGNVSCWGPNYAPPTDESLPERFVSVDVSRLAAGVSAITVGETHSCVLTGGGGACWGGNSYGQLGNGLTTDSPVTIPVDVAGLDSGIAGVAVGGMHACAITAEGKVMCWGSNVNGQLGSHMQCSSTSVPVHVPIDTLAPPPSPTNEPSPIDTIGHATGPTDVVLRVDGRPDLGVSELEGEFFNPGSFTVYGDGTVIFPGQAAEQPAAEGPILRADPFRIAHLNKDQLQALLRFAIGEGGLGAACDRYETQDTDVGSSTVVTVHVVGLEKRVTLIGSSPLGPLFDHLRTIDSANNVSSQVFVPDRYWSNLIEAASAIEIGLLPDPADAGVLAWPWPSIAPADFVGRDEGGWIGGPRRVMSVAEAAVHGLSDNGGVVQRVYLLGPDGVTIYSFSLWPMLPDETD
jgi:alpha-tubulin suppressor-like RCC1 family protein